MKKNVTLLVGGWSAERGVSLFKGEEVAVALETNYDVKIVDGLGPNGVAWLTLKGGKFASRVQSGFLYHYAFVMMIGLLGLIMWVVYGVGK